MKLQKIFPTWIPLVVSVLLLTACGPEGDVAQATTQRAAADSKVEITIGYVNWAEDVAVTHLMKALLESHFGYDVTIKPMDAPTAFKAVADGDIDAFLDVWLPKTHANYWEQYKNQVVDLGKWYASSATLGIAVPDYVDAESIADLKGQAERYNGKIVGIEAGAGVMRLTRNKVIPAYGLEDYTLTSQGTAHMIAALDEAIRKHEPIAITAWKPHWMFTAYPLRYLKDPKNTLGDKEYLHVIVRKDFKSYAPVAYRLLDGFKLTESQLGTLELAIDDARSVYGGVRAWLKNHTDVVTPWLAAAGEGRGGHPY